MASALLENLTLGVPLATDIFYFVGAPGTVPVDRRGSFSNFVFFNGALGTPISGTLTNCTGLPIAGITGLGTGVATLLGATSTGTGALVGGTSPTFTTSVTLPATVNQFAASGTWQFNQYAGQNVQWTLTSGGSFYITGGALNFTDSATNIQRVASGKLSITSNLLGIGAGMGTPAYVCHVAPTSGAPAGFTAFFQDATLLTGSTGFIVKAGVVNNNNGEFRVLDSAGVNVFIAGTGSGVRVSSTVGLADTSNAQYNLDSGGLGLAANTFVRWSQSNNAPYDTKDTGLSRISAGLLGVGTGGAGSFAGGLKLTTLIGAWPTSASGLATGQAWNNGGVLNVA